MSALYPSNEMHVEGGQEFFQKLSMSGIPIKLKVFTQAITTRMRAERQNNEDLTEMWTRFFVLPPPHPLTPPLKPLHLSPLAQGPSFRNMSLKSLLQTHRV